MTITALPTAPDRADPATFAARSDAWVAAFTNVTVPELNADIGVVNSQTSTATAAATTATNYATTTGAVVPTTAEYSAKEYAIGTFVPAGSAKEWATTTGALVDASEYSAKEYSMGTTTPVGSAKSWATKTSTVVITGEWSAKEHAVGTSVTTGSAKDWASSTGALVGATDYSAKEYAIGTFVPAGSAKEWATTTAAKVDGSDYSAKEYAVGTTVAEGSAKEWATTTGALVDATEYSAKEWAIGTTVPSSSAKTWALAAADSANSALNAPGTNATSTTSNTIPVTLGGSLTWTIQTGKAFAIGQFMIVAKTSAPSNYIVGQITAHNSGTGSITILVSDYNGTGTHTDWTFSLTANATFAVSDTNDNSTYYPLLSAGTGKQVYKADTATTPFSYNPSTGVLTVQSVAAQSTITVPGGFVPYYTFDNRVNLRTTDAPINPAALVEGLGEFRWVSGSTEADDDESCFATATGRWLLQAPSPDWVIAKCDDVLGYVQTEVNTIKSTPPQSPVFYQEFTSTVSSITANTVVGANTVYMPGVDVGAMIVVQLPPSLLQNASYATVSVTGTCNTKGAVSITFRNGASATGAGMNIAGYQITAINR
jgi:hypothetical protein